MVIRYLISVRNIPWTVSHSDFERYFSRFGSIKNARVIFNKHGLSTGYGFVEFYNNLEMRNALKANHRLEESKLSVIEGDKYLQEEEIKKCVPQYVSDKSVGNYTKDNYMNGRRTQ